MPYDIIPMADDIILPFFRDTGSYTVPRTGAGYLAGDFPSGITTVDGVPASAEVRALLRTESGKAGDGVVVAVVQSAADGTWRVDGLDPSQRYDVVGRKPGFNDVIVTNVSPSVE